MIKNDCVPNCAANTLTSTLSDWHDHQLNLAETQQAQAHIAECPACQQYISMYRSISRALQVNDQPDIREYVWQHIQQSLEGMSRSRHFFPGISVPYAAISATTALIILFAATFVVLSHRPKQQTTANIQITEYILPSTQSQPYRIVTGSDGNIWFTELSSHEIGRITPSGHITEFPISKEPTTEDRSRGLAVGIDGNIWFTEYYKNVIGCMTRSGQVTEFSFPTTPYSGAEGIAAGPDGNLWFAIDGKNAIGRITPSGQVTEFSLPDSQSRAGEITAGPDGNLWFTDPGANKIGRITPTGQITEFSLLDSLSAPEGITTGPDRNLWFTDSGANKIGRITPAGQVTLFSLPIPQPLGVSTGPFPPHPVNITTGADGNLWFTEADGNNIGRITPTGQITEFSLPTKDSGPEGITARSDGSIWFTETKGNKIGRIAFSKKTDQ
jgi:streptogramin lyase